MAQISISGPEIHDDLAKLTSLDEGVLVRELESRYNLKAIYTYVGDILVAINPFERIGIYGPMATKRYANCVKDANPPHIYATADLAYSSAVRSSKAQVCIVSGESGAGKTETTKLIIEHILSRAGTSNTTLNDRISQMSPVLEAFGNAQTVMNHNSSRFGKYLEIGFTSSGGVAGGTLSDYLLERSRVVSHARGERSFHVFYYLVAGLDPAKKETYRVNPALSFQYLKMNDSSVDVAKNTAMWKEMTGAMTTVGFDDAVVEEIIILVVTTLHFGDIGFTENDQEAAEVGNDAVAQLVAQLVMVGYDELIAAMITKVNVIRGETITKTMNARQAQDHSNAAAKAIYGRLFKWIVQQINARLMPADAQSSALTTIGLLDIFGFENFQKNSFEQICINLANESLQFFFNEHIFRLELDEFSREGLGTMDMKYEDNQPIIDLFNGKPLSIIKLLNEESKLQSSSASSLSQKMQMHLSSRHLKCGQSEFTVTHYAGKVVYGFNRLIEKNRDELPMLVGKLMKNSQLGLLKTLFSDDQTAGGPPKAGFSGRMKAAMSRRSRRSRRGAPSVRGGGRPGKKKAATTVATVFVASLDLLMKKMMPCEPHFVRCIKPNKQNAPKLWEDTYVTEQLKYTGMLETIRIRREGFAVRLLFTEFLEQYGSVVFGPSESPKANAANVSKVLDKVGLKDWRVGKTKVFLKYYHADKLAAVLAEMAASATRIQAWWRRFAAMIMLERLKALAKVEDEVATGFVRDIAAIGAKISHLQDVTGAEDDRRAEANAPSGPETDVDDFNGDATAAAAAAPRSSVPGLTDDKIKVPEPGTKKHRKYTERAEKNAAKWFRRTQRGKVGTANAGAATSAKPEPAQWFHGIVSRDQAEKLLYGNTTGTFLIRISESRLGYSMSLVQAGVFRHYKIEEIDDGMYRLENVPASFQSLRELVEYYRENDVSVNADRCLTALGATKRDAGGGGDSDDMVDYISLVWDEAKSKRVPTRKQPSVKEEDGLKTVVAHAIQRDAEHVIDDATIISMKNRYGSPANHNARIYAPATVEVNEDAPEEPFMTHTMMMRRKDIIRDAEIRIMAARNVWVMREKEAKSKEKKAKKKAKKGKKPKGRAATAGEPLYAQPSIQSGKKGKKGKKKDKAIKPLNQMPEDYRSLKGILKEVAAARLSQAEVLGNELDNFR